MSHSPALKLIFSLFPIFQRLPGPSYAGALITKYPILGDLHMSQFWGCKCGIMYQQGWLLLKSLSQLQMLISLYILTWSHSACICTQISSQGHPNDLTLTYSPPSRLHLKIQTHSGGWDSNICILVQGGENNSAHNDECRLIESQSYLSSDTPA